MSNDALEEAEQALRHGVASIDDVLDTYAPRILRGGGDLTDLIGLSEASPGGHGREAIARWVKRIELNGDRLAAEDESDLSEVDLVNLADFLDDPEALAPPETVARGLAYEGQLTLLYADPKAGKTTASVSVGAAVSEGRPWLSHPTLRGPVLYVAAEGNRRQILRRFHEFGARPEAVDVVVPGRDPLSELRALLDARDYRLVILDTLGRWMAPLEVDRWKQSDVDTVLTPLERIIRESGAALLAIHHANAEGRPIDSTGFAAWADVLRKVEDGQSERERVVTGRARFRVPDLRFRLEEDGERSRLVSVDPDRGPEEAILDFIEAHPECSKSEIRGGVRGSRQKIDDRLERLVEQRIVEQDRSGRSHEYRIAENPRRHGTATVRHDDRHGDGGNRGDTVAAAGPPTHKGGGPSATVAEPPDSANRCECGTKIGASATKCGECRTDEEGES